MSFDVVGDDNPKANRQAKMKLDQLAEYGNDEPNYAGNRRSIADRKARERAAKIAAKNARRQRKAS